jgi:hypothetical protein
MGRRLDETSTQIENFLNVAEEGSGQSGSAEEPLDRLAKELKMSLYRALVVVLLMVSVTLSASFAHAGEWSDYDDGYGYDDYDWGYSGYYDHYHPSYSARFYFDPGYSYSNRLSRNCYRATKKIWSETQAKYKRRRVVICD